MAAIAVRAITTVMAVTVVTGVTIVTGVTAVFGVSDYVSKNAGSFARMEWQFSTDASFTTNVTNQTVVLSSTSPLVGTGQGANTEYFARFRYVSDSDVEYVPDIVPVIVGNFWL